MPQLKEVNSKFVQVEQGFLLLTPEQELELDAKAQLY